ncbi:hypothetical protein [Clostridium chromiireducens]|uniref:Uncharacterized protein n=1 Tax=Clostridium chromiireducens TaxID=225345 RepID=A0A1V4IV57_9CLOT|nr:hypothetical protein [Clostridium chromiireducens]OPJ63664.1 hypothetical protein CLCHR_14790 [Clostridium chromiireducens]
MKVVAKEIEMIAHFKDDGNINPIRFRIEENKKLKVIKIAKIISTDIEKLCGNRIWVYKCTAVVDSVEKLFEIKYDIENCRWILWKI